jgi:hypothetical protein
LVKKAQGTTPGFGKTGHKPQLELRAELDLILRSGHMPDYDSLTRWLGSKNCKIVEAPAPASSNGLEGKLELVRLVTAQATAVIEASPDADNNLTAALLRLVQQHLFDMLMDLKAHDLTQRDVAKIADSVAQMTRASVMQQKWASDLKSKLAERVGAAEREVMVEAQLAASVGGGLSLEAEARIRRILMGITEQ